MKKLKFLAFALIAVLTCVGFSACGDDDKDDSVPADQFSVVGIWDVQENGDYYDFQDNGKGIFYANYADGVEKDWFAYEYNFTGSSTANVVMKWYSGENWTGNFNGTMTVAVKILSNDKITITTDQGNTATLIRRK